MRIVGLDIGRGTATCCVLESQPIDILEFARSYKPIKIKSTEISQLLELGDIYVLEPTGSDHRIFSEVLRKAGKPVLGVTGIRIRGFAKNYGILNKSDREDAAVIAAYGFQHLTAKNSKAFTSITASEMREYYLSLQAIKKQRVALVNQIRARLTYECPELHELHVKPRDWGVSSPARLWRAIAGWELPKSPNGITLPDDTVGRGISSVTQQMAEQVCNLELLAYSVECECDATMNDDRFKIYRKVFTEWKITQNTALAILASIYPIEQFLAEDGRLNYKRVYATDKSKYTRTTRNRSLKQFKRAIGAGRMWVQSGKKEFWVTTGDKAIRGSLYMFLEAIVSVRAQPTAKLLCSRYPELKEKLANASPKQQKKIIKEGYSLDAIIEKHLPECKTKTPWKEEVLIRAAYQLTRTSKRITELQLFYKLAPQCQNRCKAEKLMKTYPRFVTNLFRDLVNEYQEACELGEHDTERVLSFEEAVAVMESTQNNATPAISG